MHVEDLTLTNAKYILGVLKADLIFYQLTIYYGNNSNLLRLTTEWWTTEFNDMPHRIPTIFLQKTVVPSNCWFLYHIRSSHLSTCNACNIFRVFHMYQYLFLCEKIHQMAHIVSSLCLFYVWGISHTDCVNWQQCSISSDLSYFVFDSPVYVPCVITLLIKFHPMLVTCTAVVSWLYLQTHIFSVQWSESLSSIGTFRGPPVKQMYVEFMCYAKCLLDEKLVDISEFILWVIMCCIVYYVVRYLHCACCGCAYFSVMGVGKLIFMLLAFLAGHNWRKRALELYLRLYACLWCRVHCPKCPVTVYFYYTYCNSVVFS